MRHADTQISIEWPYSSFLHCAVVVSKFFFPFMGAIFFVLASITCTACVDRYCSTVLSFCFNSCRSYNLLWVLSFTALRFIFIAFRRILIQIFLSSFCCCLHIFLPLLYFACLYRIFDVPPRDIHLAVLESILAAACVYHFVRI